MSEEPGGPLYSEKQARAILRRAVERSAAAGGEGSSGISLAEMERIAAEIGIDPKHVRAAAADVSGQSSTGRTGIVDLEQIVPAELSEDAWGAILADLRRAFGTAGTPSAVGRTREWDNGNVHASLITRNGNTTVHLMENRTDEVAVAYVMWVIFSVFVTLIAVGVGAKRGGFDQALMNALIASAVSAAGLLGIRVSTRNWHRKLQERMEGLLRRIAGHLQQPNPAGAAVVPEMGAPDLPVAAPGFAEAPEQVVVRSS